MELEKLEAVITTLNSKYEEFNTYFIKEKSSAINPMWKKTLRKIEAILIDNPEVYTIMIGVYELNGISQNDFLDELYNKPEFFKVEFPKFLVKLNEYIDDLR
jgi:hypothetical protein